MAKFYVICSPPTQKIMISIKTFEDKLANSLLGGARLFASTYRKFIHVYKYRKLGVTPTPKMVLTYYAIFGNMQYYAIFTVWVSGKII